MTLLAMAVINKILTIPMNIKQARSAEQMAKLQPKIEEVKNKYGYDELVLQEKLKEVYQEAGANPMSFNDCSNVYYICFI